MFLSFLIFSIEFSHGLKYLLNPSTEADNLVLQKKNDFNNILGKHVLFLTSWMRL